MKKIIITFLIMALLITPVYAFRVNAGIYTWSDIEQKVDVNNDGIVNIKDLVQCALVYGTRDKVCDIDGRGKVGRRDLGLIAKFFT